jgi:kynurenine 3-monooxygenase
MTCQGAGLVGAMTAVFLGRRGYTVIMYEGRPDPRAGAGSGECPGAGGAAGDSAMHGRLANATKRSINLALSHRGLCALKKVGLEKQVLVEAVPMEGRMIHPRGQTDVGAGSIFQPYEHKPGHAIYSISREELNFALLAEVEKMRNVSIVFSAKFESFDKASSTCTFMVGEGADAAKRHVVCDFVVGADGAFSKVRDALGRIERLNFSREYIKTAYKELSIPPTEAGEFAMAPHALHIWPRDEFMLIGLPNADKSFTCTLFMPFEDLEKIKTGADAVEFFKQYFPDVAKDDFKLMPRMAAGVCVCVRFHACVCARDLGYLGANGADGGGGAGAADFFGNPTSPLLSVTCDPWHHKDKMIIIGEGQAVHPLACASCVRVRARVVRVPLCLSVSVCFSPPPLLVLFGGRPHKHGRRGPEDALPHPYL